jgi:tetratricopeptide (TPR) repeat protein
MSVSRFLLIDAALVALFVANGLRAAVINSGVCDELGAHIPAGYLYWASGEYSGGLGNFPLGQLLIAAPTYLLGHSYELFTEQHLLLFRLPVLMLGALLGLLVSKLASALYGRWAGVAALSLYALSPNILAHASIATLDLPTAFFFFWTVYCLYHYVEKPGPTRMLGLALALGFALLTKVQSVVLVGLVPAIIAVFWWRAGPMRGRNDLAASCLFIPAIVYALINLVYLHGPGPDAGWLPPQFESALRSKLLHGSRGHFGYLMGEYSETGWWYFFPVAILLKTPVPALLLVAVALFRRHSASATAFLLVPIALILGMGMASNVNIGLRHILPIYPFLFVLAGGAAARLEGRWPRGLLGVLAAGYVAQAIFITPHHLSYFNILVGGPAQGHRYLIDSNFDWGQNDHFLQRYVEGQDASFEIDPDAFHPTTGRILVNANALYGVINGGPKAYRWLKPFEPVRQIAYTWFEYEIPEESFSDRSDDSGDRAALIAHLFALKDKYGNVADIEFRVLLARSFSALGAHDIAFEEMRSVLREHPTSERALGAGGSLIVRYKLGVLRFEGDQYLTGAQTLRPEDPQLLNGQRVVALARPLGENRPLSRLYNALGIVLLLDDRRDEAAKQFRLAIGLDPKNVTARKNAALIRKRQDL